MNEPSPESNGLEVEPSSQDLAKACAEVLSEEDCQEIALMEVDEGIWLCFYPASRSRRGSGYIPKGKGYISIAPLFLCQPQEIGAFLD